MEDLVTHESEIISARVNHTFSEPDPPSVDPARLTMREVTTRVDPQTRRTGFVYSPLMTMHEPFALDESDHPEQPGRIVAIHDELEKAHLLSRMKHLELREVLRDEVLLVHSPDLWNQVQAIRRMTEEDFIQSPSFYSPDSLYVSPQTTMCAELSCGGAIVASLAVARGEVQNAFAIIRPPGHHAEPEKAMGFCFFSNLAVAARVVQRETSLKRILIVDWDVHHGNGTQKAFYNDPSILFISIHRYEDGQFYPSGEDGDMDRCGVAPGLGKNVNIPWPSAGMGDADYLFAFMKIILPIAYEFAPELVMISAGFDAARGDPLGECDVTPNGFAHMTQLLSSLAGGKVVVVLEGGYEFDVIAKCSVAVSAVLLGEIPQPMEPLIASQAATQTIYQVALQQSKYWKGLDPKGLEPDQEESSDIVTVPELLKAHRSQYMLKTYSMHTIPFVVDALQEAFEGQVIMSSDLFEDRTLVVFLHDFGNLLAELKNSLYCDLNMEHSYMVDASRHVVQWTQKEKWALIDINVLAKPRHPLSKTRRATFRDMLTYVWDNYIQLSDARNVVFVSHGSATRTVFDLMKDRDISKRVKALVQVVGMHDALENIVVPGEQEDWFKQGSYLVLPEAHPTLVTKGKALRRRFALVDTFPQERVTKLFKDAMPRIQDFVNSKV